MPRPGLELWVSHQLEEHLRDNDLKGVPTSVLLGRLSQFAELDVSPSADKFDEGSTPVDVDLQG